MNLSGLIVIFVTAELVAAAAARQTKSDPSSFLFFRKNVWLCF